MEKFPYGLGSFVKLFYKVSDATPKTLYIKLNAPDCVGTHVHVKEPAAAGLLCVISIRAVCRRTHVAVIGDAHIQRCRGLQVVNVGVLLQRQEDHIVLQGRNRHGCLIPILQICPSTHAEEAMHTWMSRSPGTA